ncbi:phosphotransferase [Niveispirillum sp. BGYR6]|uniref:aminoglycoside phosphotransferase family protein n=1 Tax=Niveispirillum sp. BGYR6 TaxID=2971249 RepID=UPI0022B96759|nr:phosphotransferase [Niveispirillum sp. BGYR6]MDG5497204.1 phosphotransferase [Niveispirillum sp. BGYR6]
MRESQIITLLEGCGWGGAARLPMGADWSTRRYERLTRQGAAPPSAILMDADGAGAAQVPPFMQVCALLRECGLSAPEPYAAAPDQGLLLLEDYGDDSFARLLEGGADPWPLYRLATDVLIHLHDRFRLDQPGAAGLPHYDLALFSTQVGLFGDAYFLAAGQPLGDAARAALDAAWRVVLEGVLGRLPVSLLLRDYHPGNLMLLPARAGVRAGGLLDVQDAGIGPVSYDLLSLLEDARRDVPPDIQTAMRTRYLDARSGVGADAFNASYAVMGAMRHARILGRVAQLCAQGGSRKQLAFLARVWGQFAHAIRHPLLSPVAEFVANHLPPDGAVGHILDQAA